MWEDFLCTGWSEPDQVKIILGVGSSGNHQTGQTMIALLACGCERAPTVLCPLKVAAWVLIFTRLVDCWLSKLLWSWDGRMWIRWKLNAEKFSGLTKIPSKINSTKTAANLWSISLALKILIVFASILVGFMEEMIFKCPAFLLLLWKEMIFRCPYFDLFADVLLFTWQFS